jgi:DNA-binding response OmpR family regulator
MRNILIADDSSDLLDMIKAIYSRRKIFIATATSREEVFSALKRITPDLILMDVILNSDDGRLLCRDLKLTDEYKSIPIILMSGSHEKLINHEKVFADDILEKPFSSETVLLKIKALTEKNKIVA